VVQPLVLEPLKIAVMQGNKPFLKESYWLVRRGGNGVVDAAEHDFQRFPKELSLPTFLLSIVRIHLCCKADTNRLVRRRIPDAPLGELVLQF